MPVGVRYGKNGRKLKNVAALAPVLAGRQALLVLRLEAVPDERELKTVELAWLLVAAGEELPLVRRRGPDLQWAGDPDELRRALRLARTRQWPGRWLTALQPFCHDRSLPLVPWRPSARRTP